MATVFHEPVEALLSQKNIQLAIDHMAKNVCEPVSRDPKLLIKRFLTAMRLHAPIPP